MKNDCKVDKILETPFQEIYATASHIYKTDGQSLDNWLNETLKSASMNMRETREEASISTYKEQFKNMLSLDLWIDELRKWQVNEYKLGMPRKEQVDPLQWNKVLKSKLIEVSREHEEEEMGAPAPNPEPVSKPDHVTYQDYNRGSEIPRKRPAISDSLKEHDQYRQVKAKKLHETHLDNHLEDIVSTEKTSEISWAIKHHPHRPEAHPPVSMSALFKKISALKKEVKKCLPDPQDKKVIHLSQLDSSKISVNDCLGAIDQCCNNPSGNELMINLNSSSGIFFIPRHNLRPNKIIDTCLVNLQKNKLFERS